MTVRRAFNSISIGDPTKNTPEGRNSRGQPKSDILDLLPWHQPDGSIQYTAIEDLPSDAFGIWTYHSRSGWPEPFQFALAPGLNIVRVFLVNMPDILLETAESRRLRLDTLSRLPLPLSPPPRSTSEAIAQAIDWYEKLLASVVDGGTV